MPRINRTHLLLATSAPILVVLASVVITLRGRPPAPAKPTAETPVRTEAGAGGPIVRKRLAVISEEFDDIGKLLDDLGEGYGYESVDEKVLRDPKASSQFKAIFLTCSESGGIVDRSLSEGVRAFVSGGGTLYASDLRYDLVAAAFPENVDRVSVSQGVKQSVKAQVTSPELRELLGMEVPLAFRLDGWRPAGFRGDDAIVMLKGRLKTTAGVAIDAPLVVKFPFGKGSVLFTSFHKERKNSDKEVALLKYLVLKTVTAGEETRETSALADDGFTTEAAFATAVDAENPTPIHEYDHPKAGPLRFRLGFEPIGATMRLEVISPDGRRTTGRGVSSVEVKIPDAAPGRWRFKAVAESAPFPNFPAVLLVGAVDSPGKASGTKKNPGLVGSGGNVKFEEISLGYKKAAEAPRPLRIAVTPPRFDDMGRLLRHLGDGFRYQELGKNDLLNPQSLDRFDLVFLTCDGWPGEWGELQGGADVREGISRGQMRPEIAELIGETLRRFVSRGGTLYASDLRKGLIVQGFPDRIPRISLDLGALPQVADAERAWIKLVAPIAQVGTLSEVIRKARLSKALEDRRDLMVAALEASPMVTIKDDLYRFKRVNNGLAGLLGLAPAAEAEAEKAPINEQNIRATLEVVGLPAVAGDVAEVTAAVSRWDLAIYEAAFSRKKENARKAANQISQAARALATARERLLPNTEGAANQVVTAKVEDPRLKESLGESIRLNFADANWDPATFEGQDVNVLMSGEYTTMSGVRTKAPLLVKFREGKGTIIFTSFHNESQNSEKELELLRYLVFSAVTAEQDALAQESMLSGGFSPVKQSQINHGAGNASVTKAYTSADSGPLRFALTFNGGGAKLRLTLIAPNGQERKYEVDSTILVEATGAPAGEWTYTVEALKVPHENFPYNVSIGKGAARPGPGPVR